MKALIAVKGSEDATFFQRAAAMLPPAVDTIVLAHVIDTGPREEIGLARERHFGRRSLSPARGEELTRAEEERGRAGLRFARQVLIEAAVSAESVRTELVRGKPREVLRDLAEREGIDILVVRARAGKPGPHSVGKTARFLIDHAPRAALLIRA